MSSDTLVWLSSVFMGICFLVAALIMWRRRVK